ncbi:MAG: hypothetical protein JNL01_06500 [Bdellovibrionales bacterium]|nr:hypothetical protein [Bdellovibrionales bacterium]
MKTLVPLFSVLLALTRPAIASTPEEVAAPKYWEVAYGAGKKQKQIQARASITQAEARSYQKLVLKKEGDVQPALFDQIFDQLQSLAKAEAEKVQKPSKKKIHCADPLVARGNEGKDAFIFKTCIGKNNSVRQLLSALRKLEDGLPALKTSKKN